MNFWIRGRMALARAIGLDLAHGQEHYARFLDGQVREGVRWLELGCGGQVIPDWAMPLAEQRAMVNRASSLVGVDVDEAMLRHPLLAARAYAVGEYLPFGDETFHLVTSNMVVEHFPDPGAVAAEIRRVLNPGGRFIFHTPHFLYYLIFLAHLTPGPLKLWLARHLEDRTEADCFQTFYRMNTEAAIRRIAGSAGLEVEQVLHRGSCGSFGGLWFLGWLECFVLRALELARGGAYRSNLIVVLRKPAATGPA